MQLTGFRSPYREECPRGLDAIAQRLVGHFLPLFLDSNAPSIMLADEGEEIDLKVFFNEHFQAPASWHEFKIDGRDFTLHGFRLHGAAVDHHELVYGAHYREVITERLAKFMPNLLMKFIDQITPGASKATGDGTSSPALPKAGEAEAGRPPHPGRSRERAEPAGVL